MPIRGGDVVDLGEGPCAWSPAKWACGLAGRGLPVPPRGTLRNGTQAPTTGTW
ncbi:hypothetical protein ACFYQ5_11850 [Streptomyces sp. NPDC005794]|uniref:hypothetical protein n=1 Tax=Streptomyces sp. NPDC005794 TaxID=3364733 RepID=UPI00369D3DDA